MSISLKLFVNANAPVLSTPISVSRDALVLAYVTPLPSVIPRCLAEYG